ncbi:MAG: DUF4276 family protein, partial [Myxococcota bacterium]
TRRTRGGGRWSQYRSHLARWTRQHGGSDCWFSVMLDLYGYPRDLPVSGAGLRGVELARAIEARIGEDIGDRRLIPYVQCHEFEALLFTDLTVLAPLVGERDLPGLDALRVATANLAPEEIDDHPETAPSKRLKAAIRDYDKVTHGPLAASTLGLVRIRRRCPHFDGWLRALERLPLEPARVEIDQRFGADTPEAAMGQTALESIHADVLGIDEPWVVPTVVSDAAHRLVFGWSCGERSLTVSTDAAALIATAVWADGRSEGALENGRFGPWWRWLRGGAEVP